MTDSITPPPELVQQWINEERGVSVWPLLTRAAQWGADMELEACCSLINLAHSDPAATGDHRLVDKTVLLKQLRAARRPKPPTLNSIALAEEYEAEANNPPEGHPDPEPFQLILRARAATLRAALPAGGNND